jgi:hypothetical protein
MPITKLGQLSANELSDLQQKHFDVDMKLRDHMTTMPLDMKLLMLSKMPSFVDGLRSELEAKKQQTEGM